MTLVALVVTYNPVIMLLSVGIAFIGAYITISLCEQLRQKKLPNPLPSVLLDKQGLIIAMSMSLGGIAIWSMHFVGMASMKLHLNGYLVVIRYNVWRTTVSLIAVVTMAMFGLFVSSYDKMFGKSKQEIIEIYVNHASTMTLAEAKKISPAQTIWIIATHALGNLICGGVVAGSGVSVMHYLGMWALEFEGGHVDWDVGIIAASILIAIIASSAAFWILFRLLSLYSHWESLRILSAAVMTVAVCGMHYTGMMAATFHYDPNHINSKRVSSNSGSVFSDVVTVALLLSFTLLIVVIIEVRTQHHQLSASRSTSRAGFQVVNHVHSTSEGVRSPEASNSKGKAFLFSSRVSPLRNNDEMSNLNDRNFEVRDGDNIAC